MERDTALYKDFYANLPGRERLAWDVALATGLRVSDIIKLRARDVSTEMIVTETKTGKPRVIHIPQDIVRRLLQNATYSNSDWCFASPTNPAKHVGRDAIGKQLHNVCDRIKTPYTLSMHSARKMYAIDLFRRTGDYSAVQRDLGHTHLATTLIYIHGAPVAR